MTDNYPPKEVVARHHAPERIVTTHLPPDQIDALRYKAFHSNNKDDVDAYYKAASLYFQERHERAINRADLLAAAQARAEQAEAEVKRLRSLPVQVKPLEWFELEGRVARAYAFYRATYMISFWHLQGQFEVALSYPGYQTNYDGERWHDTIEAAKAAAQADYEARIRTALRERGE